jgi:hypothetical protein
VEFGIGVVSTQMLEEFFVNVIQKIPKPLAPRQALEIVKDFLKGQVVIPDGFFGRGDRTLP